MTYAQATLDTLPHTLSRSNSLSAQFSSFTLQVDYGQAP